MDITAVLLTVGIEAAEQKTKSALKLCFRLHLATALSIGSPHTRKNIKKQLEHEGTVLYRDK